MTNQLFNLAAMASHNPEEGTGSAGAFRIHPLDMVPRPRTSSPESTLLERARAGDGEAFYELVRPAERMIFSAALSLLKREEEAEDVAQEAVLKAFVHLRSFRGECKFGTWLVQIVINESRMRLRRRNRHCFESLDNPEPCEDGESTRREIADAKPLPLQEVETNQLRGRLQKAILQLSPIYREVFVLRDLNQLSIAETAEALGISEASVKTRLLRARLKMREALVDYQAG